MGASPTVTKESYGHASGVFVAPLQLPLVYSIEIISFSVPPFRAVDKGHSSKRFHPNFEQ
jgi:hypothetical protein